MLDSKFPIWELFSSEILVQLNYFKIKYVNASVMFITGQILQIGQRRFFLHSSALIIIFLIIGTGRSSIFFLGHKLCPSNNNRD